MRKIYGLLLLVSIFVLVGCTSTNVKVSFDLNYDQAPAAPEAQFVEKQTKATEPVAPTREGYTFKGWFLNAEGTGQPFNFNDVVTQKMTLFAKWELIPDLTPVVSGKLYHWVPGAIEANVTATLDLKGATQSSLVVELKGRSLTEFVEFELVDDELIIYGTVLDELQLELGDHTVKVTTSEGFAEFQIGVVENASLGSSIPKEIVKGLDMTKISSFNPTEVIEGAPELMITEVGVDMGEYSYLELFNNTNQPYNLKNHRIVFGDLTKQNLLVTNGLFEEPLGMGAAMYIYQDYIIPPLSSAVVWLVASFPWTQAASQTLHDGTTGHALVEAENVQNHIFGNKPENLSIEKFRKVYNLSNDVLVFTARTQPCLVNGSSAPETNGLGAAPIKAVGSQFTGVNSSIQNRGFQIQKFDLDKKIPVTGVEGVAYYKYDVGVLNREEDLYVDGVLDRSKIEIFGKRESINAFYSRIALYSVDDEFVSYASAANSIDSYNADKPSYLKMYTDIVTPLSTALIYADYVEGTAVKWGALRSLEYTVPTEGTLMRYIPLKGMTEIYQEKLVTENPIKLMGLAPEVDEISTSTDIEVPISNAYPKDYLSAGYNTIGRIIGFNFTK